MTTFIIAKTTFMFFFWLGGILVVLKIIKNFRKCYKAHQDLISGADMAEVKKKEI